MSETKPPRSVRKIVVAVLTVVACLGLLLVAVVSLQPETFSVTRSTTIAADAADVFPHVDDLQAWQEWSPYETVDPDMEREYSDPSAGTGATYRWVGDSQAGAGTLRVIESTPPDGIRLVLAMEKPFECSNDVEFTFRPGERTGETVVTWTMSGKLGFLPKLMHLLFDMDRMVGDQFSEGLASLKSLVEQERADRPSERPADRSAVSQVTAVDPNPAEVR
ncbi:MAG: SRPBCC family protein [Maioricimonas sp. JB045]|uniref:SRPBCC family protein n=1 Tax=Maioricimonas sp. JC845 TaxID=3232138 RepID=UPI00345B2674